MVEENKVRVLILRENTLDGTMMLATESIHIVLLGRVLCKIHYIHDLPTWLPSCLQINACHYYFTMNCSTSEFDNAESHVF